jgi:hypothetical protein
MRRGSPAEVQRWDQAGSIFGLARANLTCVASRLGDLEDAGVIERLPRGHRLHLW